MNVFITQPHFLVRPTKPVLVVIPVPVETLTRKAVVVSSLNNLLYEFQISLEILTWSVITFKNVINFLICESTYGPTAPDSFHVAEDLEVPELGACDLQVVDAILSQAFFVQVRAGESLFCCHKGGENSVLS